jgi:NAD+ synthase (glutamine-hydrolysing)
MAGFGIPVNFWSIYQHGFARIAACTGHAAIADPPANAQAVLRQGRRCAQEGVAVAVFPELCLTGYSIEDLLLQDALLDEVEEALKTVVAGSAELMTVLVVGAPLRHRHRIYNCAVIVHRGRTLGVTPKSYVQASDRADAADLQITSAGAESTLRPR